MDTALSVSAYRELPSHLADADPAQQIWHSLDMLAAESPSLAKWRSIAVDGRVFPSYVFIGPRGGSVPIRLALLGGIGSEDLLSTNVIVKLLVELDLASAIGAGLRSLRLPYSQSSSDFASFSGLYIGLLDGRVRAGCSIF
jgi:hypothetical protein